MPSLSFAFPSLLVAAMRCVAAPTPALVFLLCSVIDVQSWTIGCSCLACPGSGLIALHHVHNAFSSHGPKELMCTAFSRAS